MPGAAGASSRTRRPPSLQLGLLWGAAAVSTAALAPFLPRLARLFLPVWPRCPVKLLAGVPCPACGSGRATAALARLDLAAAFAWNPLFSAAAVAFLLGGLAALGLALAGRGVPEPRVASGPLRAAVVLAVAANWCWLFLDGR